MLVVLLEGVTAIVGAVEAWDVDTVALVKAVVVADTLTAGNSGVCDRAAVGYSRA